MLKSKKLPLEKTLASMRVKIDAADLQLLNALGDRFKAVEKVGKVKNQHGLPLYQKARWEAVVEDRLKKAKRFKVSEDFTRKLLKLIHQEAIRIQKEQKNS